MTTSPPKAVVGSLMRAAVSPMQMAMVARLSQARPSFFDAGVMGSSARTAQAAKITSSSGRIANRSWAEIVMDVPLPPLPELFGLHGPERSAE